MPKPRLDIIVWGINYWPEQTGIAPFNRGLCQFLHAQGHQVSMVSAFSYYPAWRKSAEDRGKLFRTDTVDGLTVYRCWQYVPRRASTLRRIVHEASFGVSSFIRLLFRRRADIYIVISPPLLLGPLAWLISKLKRSRYVFHVQDLQPDAAVALGMIKEGAFVKLLRAAARFSYGRAGMVSGISRAMIEVFGENGVPAARQYLFPNWVVIDPKQAEAAASELESARAFSGNARVAAMNRSSSGTGILTETIDEETRADADRHVAWRERYRIPQNAFVASYSGNLGAKQGLDVLIDAALTLEREKAGPGRPVCIVIAGDGAARPALESRLREHSLSSIRLLPLLPDRDYLALLATSDVCLITQGKGTGRFCFPSKLLSTLTAARPVAAVADDSSELAHAVREGGFGILVPPENPNAVAAALAQLANRPADLEEFSRKGVRWVTRFEYRRVLEEFEARLFQVAGVGSVDS